MKVNINVIVTIFAKAYKKTKKMNTKVARLIIIMVIFKCYFSGEHIALSINKNNNGVNIPLGKTNRLKELCIMKIIT